VIKNGIVLMGGSTATKTLKWSHPIGKNMKIASAPLAIEIVIVTT